jgi:phospholipid/cholesterol/gamma-HCH transport system substrate-binding protein
MQRHTQIEITVGGFVIAGAIALGYLAITLGGLQIGGTQRYPVIARFSSVGSLKVGDAVKVAGVNVGEVSAIKLVNFAAEAQLNVDPDLKLPEDTIASVQSAGLLGDVFVALSPGASDKDLGPGGRIQRTEPAVSLTELIAKYAFGGAVDDDKSDDKPDSKGPKDPLADEPSGASPATSASEKKSPFSDPLE